VAADPKHLGAKIGFLSIPSGADHAPAHPPCAGGGPPDHTANVPSQLFLRSRCSAVP
jgi:hypothetical protein